MKIAIDCRMIGKSGIGTYIENIVPIILEYNKNNTYLLIGNKQQIEKFQSLKNVELQFTDIPPLSIKEFFFFPVSRINKCDAYYTPYINIPLGIKVPIFSTIHDVVFLDIKGLSSWFGTIVRKSFYKRAIDISKCIFTVSEFSKSRIVSHFQTNKNIYVTYSAISKEIKNFQQIQDKIYDFPYFIFVGNIKKHKGIDLLIQASQIIKETDPNLKIVIVGDYKKFKSKDKHIINLMKNISDNIMFTGYISNKLLYNIIIQAQALILPSYYEGFGLPPLEALYLGGNALISDIPVLKEIYENLPVTFFKQGDVKELAKSISTFEKKNIDISSTRKFIDSKYNFESIIVPQIINIIESNL